MQDTMPRKVPSRIRFTKKKIDSLPIPATGRQYVYDDAIPGLALCLTSTGRRTWYHYRKVNRRPERVKIGRWPEWTVESARAEAARINGAAADGNTPNTGKRARRELPTLGEIFAEYLLLPTRTKAKRPKTAETLKGYRYQFDTFLDAWRHRRLSEISRADVERLHAAIGNDHGFYMANRVLALVKALFNTVIDQGHLIVNPAARLRPFEEESRERFLQADELPKFWGALEAEPSDTVRDFIKLALFTGQRRTNVLTMRWEDLNLDRSLWIIPHTKTGRHEVPLSLPAVEILKRRHTDRGENPYVLPGRHGKGHLKDPMRQWRSILEAAGIQHLRIHDLRRSLGSWQTATGANTAIVGKTLGHSRPETTAIYSRVNLETVRQSINAAGAAILAAAVPPKPNRKKKTAQK